MPLTLDEFETMVSGLRSTFVADTGLAIEDGTVSVTQVEQAPPLPEVIEAAAPPVAPPDEWFSDPGFDRPTPLTITEDGRVYGHLATWRSNHTGFPGSNVTPPTSADDYSHFRLGELVTASGRHVPVGRITLSGGHAGGGPAQAALAHYDDTNTAVADVAAGNDRHGIWLAGGLRPGVTDEQLRVLRASPLSGDWRRIDGRLRLVAALAVNVPGFPIPRMEAMVASGEIVRMVVSSDMEIPEIPSDTSEVESRVAALESAMQPILATRKADLLARVRSE